MKCTSCGQTVYRSEVRDNNQLCPSCGHHYRLGARDRVALTCDPGTFTETHAEIRTADPLDFSVGEESYLQRIERAREQSGLNEALLTGTGCIERRRCAIGAMDSNFIMASMGAAVGEKFCRLVADAREQKLPLIVFAASGGARMQEGILALMQMAKTAAAVRTLNDDRLPYIVVLTDPTSGGVYASFASLGDVTLAEPNAYIGFAGQRLIEGALKVKVPVGFQRAEYQFQNGFIDQIVPRSEMRDTLSRLLALFGAELAPPPPAPEEAPAEEEDEADLQDEAGAPEDVDHEADQEADQAR
jgi:acetyl-CoA carboxylase carboxyl transferase subunit beta